MGVEGVDFQSFYLMPQDKIIAVVRQRWPRADVDHRGIGSGQHGIGWLTVTIALEATDIQALVHLPSACAYTAERARGPWLADRAGEVFFFASFLDERVVGRGKLKGLRLGGNCNQAGRADYLSTHVRTFLPTLFRPKAISSASSRVASGVKTSTPSVMRWLITGAASHR